MVEITDLEQGARMARWEDIYYGWSRVRGGPCGANRQVRYWERDRAHAHCIPQLALNGPNLDYVAGHPLMGGPSRTHSSSVLRLRARKL